MSTDKTGDGICGERLGVDTSDGVNIGDVYLNSSEIIGSQDAVGPRAFSL